MTSRRCCARRSSRTSGCCSSTAPCWASVRGCSTWAYSGCERGARQRGAARERAGAGAARDRDRSPHRPLGRRDHPARGRGPQPAVDVRAGKALGLGSEMVAPGLNMIGAEAGCRYVDRVPAYLNNLYRLGLIWFSREPLEDPTDYQVLEAQPDVIEAKRSGGRAKTVRRSILLTPFGEDFCRICLPLT